MDLLREYEACKINYPIFVHNEQDVNFLRKLGLSIDFLKK